MKLLITFHRFCLVELIQVCVCNAVVFLIQSSYKASLFLCQLPVYCLSSDLLFISSFVKQGLGPLNSFHLSAGIMLSIVNRGYYRSIARRFSFLFPITLFGWLLQHPHFLASNSDYVQLPPGPPPFKAVLQWSTSRFLQVQCGFTALCRELISRRFSHQHHSSIFAPQRTTNYPSPIISVSKLCFIFYIVIFTLSTNSILLQSPVMVNNSFY